MCWGDYALSEQGGDFCMYHSFSAVIASSDLSKWVHDRQDE